jgi:hypothetical protein
MNATTSLPQYAPAGHIRLDEALSRITRELFGQFCTEDDRELVIGWMLTAFTNRDLEVLFEKTHPVNLYTRNLAVTVEEWQEDRERGRAWIITSKRTHEKIPRLHGLLLFTPTERIMQWAQGIPWRGELPPNEPEPAKGSPKTNDDYVSELITQMVETYRNHSVDIPSIREMAGLAYDVLENWGRVMPKYKIERILKRHPRFPRRHRGTRPRQNHHSTINIVELMGDGLRRPLEQTRDELKAVFGGCGSKSRVE